MDIDGRGLAGPIQVEGVPCAVRIRLSRRLDVWALDGSGRRREKVETRWSGGVLSFEAGPRWKTAWCELAGGLTGNTSPVILQR